jgi:hypothetical protein
MVLKWEAQREDKGKHGKFEALRIGPFNISKFFQNNTYNCTTWKTLNFLVAQLMGFF